mgnify:CR=1 FL=1
MGQRWSGTRWDLHLGGASPALDRCLLQVGAASVFLRNHGGANAWGEAKRLAAREAQRLFEEALRNAIGEAELAREAAERANRTAEAAVLRAMGRVAIGSFFPDALQAVRRLEPAIATGADVLRGRPGASAS